MRADRLLDMPRTLLRSVRSHCTPWLKLLARCHLPGVNNAIARLQEVKADPELAGRLGVLAYPGSGKTLSMLFFSQKGKHSTGKLDVRHRHGSHRPR